MTDTFTEFVNFVLESEGNKDNHPLDRGKGSQYGISTVFLESIGRSAETLTKESAVEIYRRYFWIGFRCQEMDPLVGWCYCDALIQHPPKAAALMLQQGLGVTPDGVVGPETLDAAKRPNTAAFWQRYSLARIRYYNDIIKNDHTQFAFIDGWQARVHRLREAMPYSKKPTGVKPAVKSPAAKSTAAGVGVGALGTLVATLGFDPDTLAQFGTEVVPWGALFTVIGSWLSIHVFKRG